MDINDLRSGFTVLALFVFLGIVWWAYSDRRKVAYEEAAMLPLDDDSEKIPQATRTNERKSS
jgi:cytochrome c oxidase cbb3-type subunit 4